MKIINKWASTLISLLCIQAANVYAQVDKPNILMIITDEHNFRTIGAYRDLLSKQQAEIWGEGNVVETPNLDLLAKNGVLFDRMYASAPVCTPARAAMFTGMYGHQLGMPNNSNKVGDGKYLRSNVITIADILRDAGYETGYMGKWHLAEATKGGKKDSFWQPYPVDNPKDDYGFNHNKYMYNRGHDKFKGIDEAGEPYTASKSPKKIGLDKYGQPLYQDARSKNVKFTTDWITDRTIEFIQANKDKPFFAVASIPDPHTPDEVREPYHSMYQHMKFTLPKTYFAAHDEQNKSMPSWQKPDGKAEKMLTKIADYFGMVKCIDDNLGRLLAALKAEGKLDNTLILFSSDHGDLYGEHGRMNKGTIHETSAKVPFILSYGLSGQSSLVPAGKVIKQAANTTDWMPTLLSLVDLKSPKVAGRDLSPLFTGKTDEKLLENWHDITFSKLGFIAAIDSRYKLHVTVKEEPWLLDTQADPDELTNFIHNDKYKMVAKRLALELKDFMKTNDAYNEGMDKHLDKILSE